MFKLQTHAFTLVFLMTCSAAIAVEKTSEKSATKPVVSPRVQPVSKAVQEAVRDSNFATTVYNQKVAIHRKHLRRLMKVKSKGVTVYYPVSVPARFSLRFIRVPHINTHPDYEMQFRDKKRSSFTIESAYSGIGDGADGYRALSGYSKEFGAFKIQVFKPNSEGNNTNAVYYLSDWLKPKKKQSKSNTRYYHFFGTGVNDAEALSIVKSLTPIK